MTEAMHTKIISIEGNIGSGKSTLLKLLQNSVEDVQILKEPVAEWQSINGNPRLNLLELFYNDPKRWAYTFQSYAYYTRIRQWTEMELFQKYAVAERSVLSDKYIFAMNGKKAGYFNEVEWALYEEYFNWLSKQFKADHIDGIIYLNTPPETCAERINKRGRQVNNPPPYEPNLTFSHLPSKENLTPENSLQNRSRPPA